MSIIFACSSLNYPAYSWPSTMLFEPYFHHKPPWPSSRPHLDPRISHLLLHLNLCWISRGEKHPHNTAPCHDRIHANKQFPNLCQCKHPPLIYHLQRLVTISSSQSSRASPSNVLGATYGVVDDFDWVARYTFLYIVQRLGIQRKNLDCLMLCF